MDDPPLRVDDVLAPKELEYYHDLLLKSDLKTIDDLRGQDWFMAMTEPTAREKAFHARIEANRKLVLRDLESAIESGRLRETGKRGWSFMRGE